MQTVTLFTFLILSSSPHRLAENKSLRPVGTDLNRSFASIRNNGFGVTSTGDTGHQSAANVIHFMRTALSCSMRSFIKIRPSQRHQVRKRIRNFCTTSSQRPQRCIAPAQTQKISRKDAKAQRLRSPVGTSSCSSGFFNAGYARTSGSSSLPGSSRQKRALVKTYYLP